MTVGLMTASGMTGGGEEQHAGDRHACGQPHRLQPPPGRSQVPARAGRRCGGRAALRGRVRARCRSTRRLLIWHLYQAALAGRDIFYDQRYAHNLEMRDVLEEIITHPAGVDPRDARGDPALHEAVLDQHRPVQQPDRAQVRAEVHAGGVCRRGARGRRRPARSFRCGPARRSTRCSRGCSRCSST